MQTEQAPRQSAYQQWIAQEGIPILHGHGITDVMNLELRPWGRLGGRGAYIDLMGMEGITGMYLAEIPPGGALEPEKHLYDETIYILSGRGSTKVWNGGRDRPDGTPTVFEWQAGSLFAPPINTWHQLFNLSGSEPVRLLATTLAPLILDIFHNPDFVFNCDYAFTDRYSSQPDYYEVRERFFFEPDRKWLWETNYIPDVRGISLIDDPRKAAGGRGTHYQMGGNVLVGHMYEFPAGCYHKAHAHGGGAILLNISDCRGYTLLWPPEAGIHPYQTGNASKVVRVDWQDGSIYSPASGWFHQHFNTGQAHARQLAFRLGSHRYGVTFHDLQEGKGQQVSVKEGGTLIEYEDEDPNIRRDFQRELAEAGIEYQMEAMPVL